MRSRRRYCPCRPPTPFAPRKVEVLVFAAVEDLAPELGFPRVLRPVDHPVETRAYHHSLCLELRTAPGGDTPVLALAANVDDLFSEMGLEPHFPGVVLVVPDQFPAGNIAWKIGREGLVGQGRELLDGVEVQAIVMLLPGMGDLFALLEHLEGNAHSSQAAAHRQTGRARSDNEYGAVAHGRKLGNFAETRGREKSSHL